MLRTLSVDSLRFNVSSSSALSVATLVPRLLDDDLWAARLLADAAADGNEEDVLVVSLMGGWKKCRVLVEDDGAKLAPDMVTAQASEQTN